MQNVTAQLKQWLLTIGFANTINTNEQPVYCFNYDQRWLLNIQQPVKGFTFMAS